jgi:hypothetical protein
MGPHLLRAASRNGEACQERFAGVDGLETALAQPLAQEQNLCFAGRGISATTTYHKPKNNSWQGCGLP